MRLIRITTNYPTYLQQFYSKNPELIDKSYAIQYQQLVNDCFGWADFWNHAFNKLGYEVWEPVGNAEPMQKMWAKENNIIYHEDQWLYDITKAQVKHFKPDVLFMDDYSTYSKEFVADLRAENPSIKLVLGWCGAPYGDKSVFSSYDIVLSNIPLLVNTFRQDGHRSEYVKHAFESRILDKIDLTQSPSITCSFIGSIFTGNLGHNSRAIIVKELIKNIDLQLYCDVYKISQKQIYSLKLRGLIFDIIQQLSKFDNAKQLMVKIPKVTNYVNSNQRPSMPILLDELVIKNAKKPVFGLEMFQTLHNSKITFNNHIDISAQYASNMRLFEATGVGTCLLTDWKDNLPELFEPDREVVTYKSVEECIEKVKWLLDNPQEREAIALAGQARTLRDHTFDKRAIQLDEIIKKMLST